MSALPRAAIRNVIGGVLLLCMASASAAADRLDDIVKRGTLNVAVSMFLPWTMKNKSDQLIGFEIDVARKVAAELGVEPKFTVYPWDNIFEAVGTGDADLIAASVSITAGRALLVSYSDPYSEDGVSLATNTPMTANFSGFKDFDKPGVTIGTVAGTVYADVAKRKFSRAKIKEFLEPTDAETAVLEGNVHAYAASVVETRFLALEYPQTLDVPLAEPLQSSRAAFAVRRGEFGFVNFLNAWIIEHEANEWLIERRRYWFESRDWQDQVD